MEDQESLGKAYAEPGRCLSSNLASVHIEITRLGLVSGSNTIPQLAIEPLLAQEIPVQYPKHLDGQECNPNHPMKAVFDCDRQDRGQQGDAPSL